MVQRSDEPERSGLTGCTWLQRCWHIIQCNCKSPITFCLFLRVFCLCAAVFLVRTSTTSWQAYRLLKFLHTIMRVLFFSFSFFLHCIFLKLFCLCIPSLTTLQKYYQNVFFFANCFFLSIFALIAIVYQ